jgi:hypothetical protein
MACSDCGKRGAGTTLCGLMRNIVTEPVVLPYFAHIEATWLSDSGSGAPWRLAVGGVIVEESPNHGLERA